MNVAAILALTRLGIDLVEKIIVEKSGKPIEALSTDEMLAEIATIRASLTDAGAVFDAAAHRPPKQPDH